MQYVIKVPQQTIIKSIIFDRAFSSGYDVDKSRFKKAINWLLKPKNEATI